MKLIKIVLIAALTTFSLQAAAMMGPRNSQSPSSPYYSSSGNGGFLGFFTKAKSSSTGTSFFSNLGSPAVAKNGPKHSRGTFIFSPRRLTWAAYDSTGNLVRSGRASGGSDWCPDVGRSCHTPRGKFNVVSKGSANCKSTKYPLPRGGAPMPYCMYFSSNYAIHGSYHVPNYNASHGCIRVMPEAAQWLHQNFIQHGTKVIVQSY